MLEDTTAVPASLMLKGVDTTGEAGREWRRRLPATVASLAERWSLALEAPFRGLSYNYAAPVTQADGTPAVLKLWMPLQREFDAEVEALRIYEGDGAVKLLLTDVDECAMLLERAEPGNDLWQLDDEDQQIEVAAMTMRRLWRSPPAGCSLPLASTHYERMRAKLPSLAPAGFPLHWMATAIDIFAALQSAAPPVVLHEDLHQANILRAQREPWLAIDPHGLVGPRELETTPMILNVLWRADPGDWARIISRYVDAFADSLGLDAEQVRLAGVARAVLEAFWTLEDKEKGMSWQRDVAIVDAFDAAR